MNVYTVVEKRRQGIAGNVIKQIVGIKNLAGKACEILSCSYRPDLSITDKIPVHPLGFLLLHGGCCRLFLQYNRGQEYLPVQGYLED